MEANKMSEAAKQKRREYLREWRKKNKEHVREYNRKYNANYWEKKAQAQEVEENTK